MAYIRGQERMVAQTTWDYVKAQLVALGWQDTAGSLPYGAENPVRFQEFVPARGEATVPNTVAFTTGDEPEDSEGELGCAGGGLWITDRVAFIDVLAETQGVAKAIIDDIRAILSGRLPNCSRYQVMTDYSVDPNVPTDHLIHYEHVVTEVPMGQEYKADWRVVKFTIVHEYTAVEVGTA